MTKKRSSKRALLLSALSLLLCTTMLIGSTFAWFTDSVTSSGNIITSGTLDVSMEWADGKTDPDNTTWTDASTGAIFDYDNWEPGYVEVRHIKIKNNGTLALKYQLNVAANGEVSKLADVIDVYYADPAVQVPDRTALAEDAKLGTLTAALAGMNTTASGNLESGEAHTITLALKMQESAGNEYQGLSIGSDFAIQLFATQLTSEEDAFDNQYDGASTFLNQDENGNWLIASAADMLYLAQQVNSGHSYQGETILLANDVDLKNMKWTPIGNGSNGFMGTFDGQGHSISNFNVTGTTSVGLFGYALNGGNIKNLTVKNAMVKANDYAGAILGRGYTDVVNCHVEDSVITVTPYLTESGVYDGGAKAGAVVGQLLEGAGNSLVNCTAKNVKVSGYRDIGAVLGMAHNNNTVTDCKAYDSVISCVYLEPSQSYDGNTPNQNIGEVIGRRNYGVIESGTYAENVSTNSVFVYGLQLTPISGNNSNYGTITVYDQEGLLNLSKLSENWDALFSDGNGTQYINYPVKNYYYNWTWNIVLAADIDFGGASIQPIDLGKHLHLDGQGHTIKNAVITTDSATQNEAGLFNAAQCGLKNLRLENIRVTGSNVGNSTAGVVSGSCNAPIENITIKNSTVTGGKYTGGVVGYGYTKITNCSLTNVTVNGGYKLGGLIGYICATSPNTGDVIGNTLTDCNVDGIGNNIFAGGKDRYIVGKLVGNYNTDGTCNNNIITNMTSSATDNIGEIEAGKNINQ